MQETWVQSLGREDPLKEGMATHSSILAWEIPWTEEPGVLQSTGSQKTWTRLSDSSMTTTGGELATADGGGFCIPYLVD